MRKKRGFGAHAPIQRGQQLRALRLLVCMLPYLFFALLSDGLHTHDLAELSSKVQSSSVPIQRVQSHLTSAVSGHSTPSDANCLACEWSANSASILPALPVQFSQSVEVERALEAKTEAWSSRSVASALGRGPPAL